MGFLFGRKQSISTTETKLGALRVQNSTQGVPIPIVYGKTRITPNLLWRDDFTAIPHTTSTHSGKGGSGVDTTNTTYTYTVAIVFGLCEGPSVAGGSPIGTVWKSKDITDAATLGLSEFPGSYTQIPWGYLTTNHPTQALNYRGTTYAACGALDLGNSDSLPNYSFEVTGLLGSADVDPGAVVTDFLTSNKYGAGWTMPLDTAQFTAYCTAANIAISAAYTAQQSAADTIKQLALIGNATPVWSAGTLRIIPYTDEVVGGFTPDLTVQYSLTYDDFIASADAPVKVTRARQADSFNQIQVEVLDRANAYNTAVVYAQDQGAIDLYGLRPAPQVQMHEVCTLSVARTIAQTMLQRALYVRNVYEFTVGWKYGRLEPMDIVALTDPLLGLVATPVRIISIEENENGELTMQAESLDIGVSTPGAYAVQTATNNAPNNAVDPGNANAPVMFQPPLALSSAPQIWIGASGGANWGGAQIWASTDNATYRQVGTLTAPATYGTLTANLPSHVDPDTANTLSVDLSNSKGAITGVSAAIADSGGSLSWIGAANTGGELVAYSAANLTSNYHYDLSTYIRRARYGTQAASHGGGQNFMLLDDAVQRIDISKAQFNTTIYIKLLSFNKTGGGLQSLANVSANSFAVAYQLVVNGIGYAFIVDTTSTGMGDPGSGKLRFNSATQNAATQLDFSNAAADGGNMSTFWAAAGNHGVIDLRDPADTAKWATFTFNAATNGASQVFNVAYQTGGVAFPNSDVVEMTLKPTGVTSVGLVMPAIFTVANSPVTTTGNLTVTLVTQNAGVVWAGPTTGNAAAPAFRNLVASDFGSENAGVFLAGPSSGGAANASMRAITGNDIPPLTLNTQTANYTLALSDGNGVWLAINSANAAIVTVPSAANVSFANGVVIPIERRGAGNVTISAQANVTVHNSSSNTARAQYSVVGLKYGGGDDWTLFGDTS